MKNPSLNPTDQMHSHCANAIDTSTDSRTRLLRCNGQGARVLERIPRHFVPFVSFCGCFGRGATALSHLVFPQRPLPTRSAPLSTLVLFAVALGLSPGWSGPHALAQEPPTYYVNAANPTPLFPYTSWATAATNIQSAVNAGTTPGRLILVTDGVYEGGLSVAGAVLRSVRGPAVTIIDGPAVTSTASESGSQRSVSLGANGTLSGFTVRNGGGVNAEASGVVTNCVLTGNTTQGASTPDPGLGGGAYGGTLYNCVLSGNWAKPGWFVFQMNVVPIPSTGGGAYGCTLYDCTLSGNSASFGGGASECTLYNCTLTGNPGDGASGSTLYKCTLHDNSGVGASASTLYQCTVTGNSGGGVRGGKLYNCIVYFNQGPNWSTEGAEPGTLEYCCTAPLPPGPGNFSADPMFVSVAHLSASSPCLGAGNPAWATGTDLDGEPWADPPAVGADQVWPGQSTGPLTMQIAGEFAEFATSFPVSFTAHNTGPILRSVWDFGDGTVLTNQPFTSHAWTTPGAYTVRLTGYNDSHPAGVSTALDVEVVEMVHYVDAANRGRSVFPFRTWATAATNIQDAVNASTVPGRLVLVTNGVYQTGRVDLDRSSAYRVALTNVVLRSVNGPEVTVIDGEAEREFTSCVYVGANAILTGFTLQNGYDHGVRIQSALARWRELSGVVTKCVMTGNYYSGASGGTLYNCVLTGNFYGASSSTLYNCVLTGNGGGVSSSRLFNCIVYFNGENGNDLGGCSFEYSCTTPLPPGPGNIEADPRFVNAAAGNFRLRPDSPCIDAGTNLTEFLTTDILGLPRPLDGNGDGVARFDMGAYEFALLTLRFAPNPQWSPDGFHFTVLGEPGRTVRLERSRDLRSWETVTTVPALPETGQALRDAEAVGERRLFYRAVSRP